MKSMKRTAAGVLAAACLTACAAGEPDASAAPTEAVEWSGPVRAVAGGAAVHSAERGRPDEKDADLGWADITNVSVTTAGQIHWSIQLAEKLPAAVDRAETVIAYGLVLDGDGDGVADYVVGIDDDAPRRGDFRVWVTNLASGETETQLGPPYGFPVEFAHPDERQPGDMPGAPTMTFTFLPGSNPPGVGGDVRFYAWASVTDGDDVVAWDYAPDADWLEGEPPDRLGCTPLACPMLGPASMPPGSRQLVVSVRNEGSEPALLFVAQDEGVMGELIGTAEPAMVPAGTTSDVVFTIPPAQEWAIFVNPTSESGPLVTRHDVPSDATGRVPFWIEIFGGTAVSATSGTEPGWFGN